MNEKFFDLKSDKQDKMINAALHMFADNGYKHASTDDIVREAGISKGLLFHYFINKEGLYSFLTDYSVKYLLFEFERVIGGETDFFAFHEKLETAKLGVLRNYPYMYKFMERSRQETDPDIRAMGRDSIERYDSTIGSMLNKLVTPELRTGITQTQLNAILKHTIAGLTAEHMASRHPDPDVLNAEISDYIRLFKTLTTADI